MNPVNPFRQGTAHPPLWNVPDCHQWKTQRDERNRIAATTTLRRFMNWIVT